MLLTLQTRKDTGSCHSLHRISSVMVKAVGTISSSLWNSAQEELMLGRQRDLEIMSFRFDKCILFWLKENEEKKNLQMTSSCMIVT